MRDCTEEENEYLKRYAEQERNVSGPRRSVHLWEFLLELLMEDSNSTMIQWTDELNGEFKLKNSEDVARKWGQRKHKEGMNYDKLSRALRYYYSKEIIKKVSGRRFVYKFVPSPEIYAAVNAIKAHMIRNGATHIPLGPFPHYQRQPENIPTGPDNKPFMYYHNLRPRSISPRTESDRQIPQPRPSCSSPKPQSQNYFRTEERYQTDGHIILGHPFQNEELVRKIKYFEQEETKFTSSDCFRRRHSENDFLRDESRHHRLTPPLDTRREHHLQNDECYPYKYKSSHFLQEPKPSDINMCLNNNIEQLESKDCFRRQINGVVRESETHHEDHKPSAFIALESRHIRLPVYPPSQIKSEPQTTEYCKDCPTCNLQPLESEGKRTTMKYESIHREDYNDTNSPSKEGMLYRRTVNSIPMEDYYPRKYVEMVDASTQTTEQNETSTATVEHFNNKRYWVDLNKRDLRVSSSNGQIVKTVSPLPFNDKKKSYSRSPDEFSGSDNVSRISTPNSITNPPTPVPTPLLCKCGCMDTAMSPSLPTANDTVVVYPKEVL